MSVSRYKKVKIEKKVPFFKRKESFVFLFLLVFGLVTIIGSSYAVFTMLLTGNKGHSVMAGTFRIDFEETDTISLLNTYPMSDEEGLRQAGYTFTITNTGTVEALYRVKMVDDGANTLDRQMIRFAYQKNSSGMRTPVLLSSFGSVMETNQTLAPGESATYTLKMWLKEEAGNEVQGTLFKSKIVVEAVQKFEGNSNIVAVYQYDASSCLTGEEETCVELVDMSFLYEPGTIIKYKVNDTLEKYFHVISDDGSTITMQQRENTINSISWYDGGNGQNDNTKGPLTVLPALENATAGWINVNDQTYTMGVTVFEDNAYTGCQGSPAVCSVNTYVLPERIAKARMITVQESVQMGCMPNQERSCPIWMYNYLKSNSSYGGTEPGINWGYWTMSANSSSKDGDTVSSTVGAADIISSGMIGAYYVLEEIGARAVVVIDK